MKFGKLLKSWADETPENGDLVLRFKELKKQLKLIKPSETDIGLGELEAADADPEPRAACAVEHQAAPQDSEPETSVATTEAPPISAEERAFVQTLKEDLDKFNEFFIDKEEDFIIRYRVLEDSLEKETDMARLQRIRKEFADLHGSMILLLHWSLLNFTAVVKILKKHDKRTGVLLREPLLASIHKQPFNSTDRITALIKKAEEHCQILLDKEGVSSKSEGQQEESQPVDRMREQREQHAELCRRTKTAIDVWEEMRATAATPSTVLPAAKRRKTDANASTTPSKPADGQS